jgi:hypothetical protein
MKGVEENVISHLIDLLRRYDIKKQVDLPKLKVLLPFQVTSHEAQLSQNFVFNCSMARTLVRVLL